MAQVYCIVKGCRFPSTHLTCSHKCGRCGKFGHGQMECCNWPKIVALRENSHSIVFPPYIQCQSILCPCPWTHSYDGHYCTHCGERHHETLCPHGYAIMTDPEEINHVKQVAQHKFGNNEGKIFTKIYTMQGCVWYVKRKNHNKNMVLLFMNNDNHDRVAKFCSGFIEIE